MAEQSKVEKVGIELRDELQIKNKYFYDKQSGNDKNLYKEGCDDAMATGDPLGKGTGISMGYSLPSDEVTTYPGTISRKNFVTTEDGSTTGKVGGQYDIEGYGGLEGKSGRKYLSTINKYSNINEYGTSSIDTTQNQLDGQIIVK